MPKSTSGGVYIKPMRLETPHQEDIVIIYNESEFIAVNILSKSELFRYESADRIYDVEYVRQLKVLIVVTNIEIIVYDLTSQISLIRNTVYQYIS